MGIIVHDGLGGPVNVTSHFVAEKSVTKHGDHDQSSHGARGGGGGGGSAASSGSGGSGGGEEPAGVEADLQQRRDPANISSQLSASDRRRVASALETKPRGALTDDGKDVVSVARRGGERDRFDVPPPGETVTVNIGGRPHTGTVTGLSYRGGFASFSVSGRMPGASPVTGDAGWKFA